MQVEARAGRASSMRQASNAYLMSWVAMAAFGLGYIGVAATRPDLLGAILPIAEPAQEQVVAGRTAGDIADELATLRKWVHDLQHELAATRSTLQDQVAQNSAIVQRLGAAEEKLSAVREVKGEPAPGRATVQRLQRGAQAPATPVPPTQPAEPPQRVAQAAPPAAPAPDPQSAGVRVLNGGTSQISTGSVPDAAAPPAATPGFSQPKVTQPSPQSPRAVEIASSDSLEGLKARWGELSGRNADVLAELSPRYRLSTDGRQAPFTLLAGPFESTADATRTCNALRAKGVSCRVGPYAGSAF